VANLPQPATAADETAQSAKAGPSRRKLGYKERRELDQLPDTIERLENRHRELNARINTPDFYRQEASDVQRVLEELKDLEASLERTFERWNELEDLASRSALQ
jgi:ATP-binding cassette subfamily F protein uup